MSQKSQNSQSARNGSILSYFKPLSQPKTPGAPASQHSDTQRQPESPQLPSSPLSIRSTSIVVAPLPANSPRRDAEIAATDEEDDGDDDFSDDSLEDLSTLLGQSRPSRVLPKTKPVGTSFATPRSKRTAVELQSSPLSVMPKHKFDLKALAKDALQDDAINASSLRVKNGRSLNNEGWDDARGGSPPSANALVDIVNERTGQDAHKVLRAVQRAEPGHAQLWLCFFEQDHQSHASLPVPKKASPGPWQLITGGTIHAREQNLASGLPLTIMRRTGEGPPDELFEWMLDEICVQRSILVRQEYCNIIEHCPDLVHQLLTPEKLEHLFLRLGADEALKDMPAELHVSRPNPVPYQRREWSCLEVFLDLLGSIAKHLSTASVEYAVRVLLRMSFDRLLITNNNLLERFQDAARNLLDAIPHPSWDAFCFDVSSLLHGNVKIQCIRANVVLCLPQDTPRCHELRRRLAVAFLFNDSSSARRHPDNFITIRGAIGRLSGDDFAVGPKTDFAELRASIILLDVCIDDGSFAAVDDSEDEGQFNEAVDELATKLREIWRKINDSGMKLARTEAKSVIEWLEQRLIYSVRTKRRTKKSVFDLSTETADPFLPRQQDFMQRFLKKPPQE